MSKICPDDLKIYRRIGQRWIILRQFLAQYAALVAEIAAPQDIDKDVSHFQYQLFVIAPV